ncbi:MULTISPECIES: SDR family NAD(P)-dependent oxidoreductase [Actinokineospora]|uniref:Oxidoreductase n=1 Tax=Actinokineospora fastidiosa TaxID=1816 RepID=A0A918GHN7_9PSEU|nr:MULTISPECIES: SDR family NAD(P)-dependent oxidoreductase [Actinokineospora]UVS80667.1 NADP-dependent 3-hydroxy acid dehydrogenase YdfG [Actinokineospora sp. UTMC 2448]GGS36377.1 oxidoreductase [Actinokineospora fastidiosa]
MPLAMVTGASSGIGLELSREFAEHGFDVVMVAEEAAIHTAAAEIGPKARPLQLDLTDPAAVEELIDQVGIPDAVAINAGTGVGGAFVHETTLEDQLATVDLNIRSAVHLAKRVLPGMVDRKSGRVMITSSIASAMPGPYQAVYNASKAFLRSFAQGVRQELKGTGVTITTLMPGLTETRFFERAGMLDTKLGATSLKGSATTVAHEGFEALMKGRSSVIPGTIINRLQTLGSRLLPDRVLAAVHGKLSKPGTA